eukprot:9834_1
MSSNSDSNSDLKHEHERVSCIRNTSRKNEALQNQFETACQHGIVTTDVLMALQTYASPSIFNAQFSKDASVSTAMERAMAKKVKVKKKGRVTRKSSKGISSESSRKGGVGNSSTDGSSNEMDLSTVSPRRLYTYIPKDWKRHSLSSAIVYKNDRL